MIREQIMVDWLPFGLSQCKGSGECGCMCVVGGWGVLGGVGEGGGGKGAVGGCYAHVAYPLTASFSSAASCRMLPTTSSTSGWYSRIELSAYAWTHCLS